MVERSSGRKSCGQGRENIMIRILQLKLPVDHTPDALEKKICQQLKIKKEELSSWKIVRRSLDARKKPDLKFVYVVDVDTPKERKILHRMQKVNDKNIMLTNKTEYQFPAGGTEKLKQPPVVIGSGPAGLFCAWALAKAGLRPVVYERGEKASERKKTVDQYWKDGILDPNSNVQFGEGGAGTFSDGKLNTLVKDPVGRHRKVLEIFVQGGAPDHILYEQKPHLGTDQLIGIVTSLREQIEQMGGRFCFTKQVTDLDICDGKICRIQLNRNEWIETQVCIAAVGHSARDTFSMLKRHGIYMEAKSFAVGVRIEHPQKMINLSQYGQPKVKELGAASYKLTHQLENGRGIYSFCMCPGGYVVDASSEKGYLAVNGMSYQARDSRNANSAMIVTVSPQDYVTYGMKYLQQMGEDALAAELDQNPLAGIFFQRYLEQKAYQLHEGRIPVQTYGDFHERKETKAFGEVEPCIRGSVGLMPFSFKAATFALIFSFRAAVTSFPNNCFAISVYPPYFSLPNTLSKTSSAILVYFSSIASHFAFSSSAYSLFFMDLVLMYTFRLAPCKAALQNAAPTPASLIASVEPFAANSTMISIASQHFSMISIGTEQASFRTISITLAFSAFSSSVSLGIPYALESGSKTSASRSIRCSSSF